MPPTGKIGKNAIDEFDLPENIRSMKKGISKVINSSNSFTKYNKIELAEAVKIGMAISINTSAKGIVADANNINKPCEYIALENGEIGQTITVANNGDFVDFGSSIFTTDKEVFLSTSDGNKNVTTDFLDLTSKVFIQKIGHSINPTTIFYCLEEPIIKEV
jgi:hypothetical protein